MKMAFTTFLLLTLAALMGCVSGDQRPYMNIVQDDARQATSRDMDVDAKVPGDAAIALAPIPANREVWLIVDTETPALGFRGQLRPPHEPIESLETLLDRLMPAAHLVVWDGPGTARDQLLGRLWQSRDRIVPFYVGSPAVNEETRLDRIRADLRMLVAEVVGRANSLRRDERPVIGIDLVDHLRGEWATISQTLAEIAQPVFVVARLLDEEVGIEGIDGYWRRCAAKVDDPIIPLAPGEIGCVSGGLGPDGQEGDVRRRIHRRRQQTDRGERVLLVDGLGRWQSDRQMDPVAGMPTSDPPQIARGRRIEAYGQQRMLALERLTANTDDFSLLRAFDGAMLTGGRGRITAHHEGGQTTLELDSDSARLEAILNTHPLNVRRGTAIQITSLPASVSVSLIFSDGEMIHLRDMHSGSSWIEIAPEGHRRLEDVYLVYETAGNVGITLVDGVKVRVTSSVLGR